MRDLQALADFAQVFNGEDGPKNQRGDVQPERKKERKKKEEKKKN